MTGAHGVADYHQPLTEHERTAGVIAPDTTDLTAPGLDGTPAPADLIADWDRVAGRPSMGGIAMYEGHAWHMVERLGTSISLVRRGPTGNTTQHCVPTEWLTVISRIADANPLLVWVFEDEGVGQGDMDVFTDALGYATNTDYTIQALYVVHGGKLHQVQYATKGTPFNSNDWSTVTVTVTLPDSSTLTSAYRVDGRA